MRGIRSRHFNPLPPYGGRRPPSRSIFSDPVFQSTPSVWRETCTPTATTPATRFQSTPSVWRETCYNKIPMIHMMHFNPLPPYGGRPAELERLRYICEISIHSLRMEGDLLSREGRQRFPYFNPLPPYGGRHDKFLKYFSNDAFQSTPSVWRETIVTCVSF